MFQRFCPQRTWVNDLRIILAGGVCSVLAISLARCNRLTDVWEAKAKVSSSVKQKKRAKEYNWPVRSVDEAFVATAGNGNKNTLTHKKMKSRDTRWIRVT